MKSLITEPLGLYGWRSLEGVLLAALLSEEPLLLIGAHGCAKSFVLERLAESLGLSYRFYNASLINYDDLVGVPLPDASRTKLEYIASPESIWDAEVVFVDEISRTRPDLQNKLFPIIYDKRIQGRPLERLAYRWAAMNPPPTEEELENASALYLGSEPLDAALADRFSYVVEVPDWSDLAEAEQTKVLSDQFAGRHAFPVPVKTLVEEARRLYQEMIPALTPILAPYVLLIVPKLRAAHYDISTRRATVLLRCAIQVHAARVALARRGAGEEPELSESVRLALANTLPDRTRRKVSFAEISLLCKSAWELASLDRDDPLAVLLCVDNPVCRLRKMIAENLVVAPDRVAVIVCEGIAGAPKRLRRGIALASYFALRQREDLAATTIETLAHEIRPVLEPVETSVKFPRRNSKIVQTIAERVESVNARFGAESDFAQYHANLLNSYLPDGFSNTCEVNETSEGFEQIWKEFRL